MRKTNNKTIIFYTGLSIWSMKNKSGAPSFYKTVELYIDKGFNVYLVTFNPDNYTNDIISFSNIYCMDFKERYKKISKKKIGKLYLFWRQIDFVKYAKKVSREILKKERGSQILIYAYEVHGVGPAKRIADKYGLPLITRFQGTILNGIPDTFINRIKKYPHFSALKQKADLIIMTNDGTQGEKTLHDLKNKSENIKFWVNGLDLFKMGVQEKLKNIKKEIGLEDNDKMLLTVSRLEGWKRVDRAIKALAGVLDKHPECKLVIVGDGTCRNDLIAYAKSLGLEKNVVFVGSILHSEVYDYMYSADIFLSLYDLSNVGNPLLESLTLGCCDIVLNTGDTGRFIKNNINGFIINAEELEELPHIILSVLENEELRQKVKKGAKEWALKNLYSWDKRMEMEYEAVSALMRQEI